MKECLTDNQQPSLRDQGVQLLTRTKTVNRKSYGLYLCPKCNSEIELRIDTVNTHYKRYDYPKFCSACANKSAGENRIQHGGWGTTLYKHWENMKARCYSKNYPSYEGREVHTEWKNSFNNFKLWAEANGFKEGLSLDRIDNSGNYTPDNCQWITIELNSGKDAHRDSSRSNIKLTSENVETINKLYSTGKYTHQQLADLYNVARTTITSVISKKGSTTIPKGSTSQANGDGNSEHPKLG